MIPAYEGKEPYIFVSYAHKDSPTVFRIIEKLSARGYRIWYDEGIEPGSEWPEYIANHLIGAEMVLSFLTPNAVQSVNCRREVNFALSKNKPVLAIYMDKFEIPAGMELQLSSQQNVLYYNYDSEERFLDKVETCQHLIPCRTEAHVSKASAGQGSAPTAGQSTTSSAGQNAEVHAAKGAAASPSTRAPKPQGKIILIAGVCIAALMLVFFLKPGNKKEPENTVVETTTGDNTDTTGGDNTDATGGDNTDTTGGDNTDVTADDTGTDQTPGDEQASAPTADATWDYTITRSEESTTYSFARGPQIVMPASWGSQVTVIDEGNHVSFYHTASMEAWAVDGYDNTGYLFKLYLDQTQDYKNLPSFMDLGKTSEGYFYLMFPTDFQAYAENERIMNQYQDLYNEIDYVKLNSHMAD